MTALRFAAATVLVALLFIACAMVAALLELVLVGGAR